MPRSKRSVRHREHECHVCEKKFLAVRDDARYCSAKCRQVISRACKALNATRVKNPKTFKVVQVRCASCGISSDASLKRCAVCGSALGVRTAKKA